MVATIKCSVILRYNCPRCGEKVEEQGENKNIFRNGIPSRCPRCGEVFIAKSKQEKAMEKTKDVLDVVHLVQEQAERYISPMNSPSANSLLRMVLMRCADATIYHENYEVVTVKNYFNTGTNLNFPKIELWGINYGNGEYKNVFLGVLAREATGLNPAVWLGLVDKKQTTKQEK